MHATIFGNVASIVSRMYARRAEYDRKVLDLEHFAAVHKLPREIRHRQDMHRYLLKSMKQCLVYRMEDHLQTKWFFDRGLNSKARRLDIYYTIY